MSVVANLKKITEWASQKSYNQVDTQQAISDMRAQQKRRHMFMFWSFFLVQMTWTGCTQLCGGWMSVSEDRTLCTTGIQHCSDSWPWPENSHRSSSTQMDIQYCSVSTPCLDLHVIRNIYNRLTIPTHCNSSKLMQLLPTVHI